SSPSLRARTRRPPPPRERLREGEPSSLSAEAIPVDRDAQGRRRRELVELAVRPDAQVGQGRVPEHGAGPRELRRRAVAPETNDLVLPLRVLREVHDDNRIAAGASRNDGPVEVQ